MINTGRDPYLGEVYKGMTDNGSILINNRHTDVTKEIIHHILYDLVSLPRSNRPMRTRAMVASEYLIQFHTDVVLDFQTST